MEILKETRFIERLQFFNGQRLFASDLQGLEAFNREMRWLHNKSLHQPGIGNGFAVSGKKGEREVSIGAGYAIDALGREIVLLENQIEPIPPVAGESDGTPALYYLTVSYPDDADLEETELREGICDTRGAIRLREQPVFCWVSLTADGQPKDTRLKQEILSGMKLVLAQAEVLNCQLNKDVSIAQRLSARPPTQPYICCLTAEANWEPLLLAEFDSAKLTSSAEGQEFLKTFGNAIRFFPMIAPVGLQMTINTAECGFKTTPCYSARIAGPRVKRLTREKLSRVRSDVDTSSADSEATNTRSFETSFIVDGLVQVIDPEPDRFTVNVLLMVQLLLPTGTDQDTILRSGFEGAIKKGKTASASSATLTAEARAAQNDKFQKLIKRIIDLFFSDWTVEWIGIEG